MKTCSYVKSPGVIATAIASAIAAMVMLAGCAHDKSAMLDATRSLESFACSGETEARSLSPWHIRNLYDCDTGSLYIPYQLWTGAPWDGNKQAPCEHQANTLFDVDGDSPTRITGSETWVHPHSKKSLQVWRRAKLDGSKIQLFTCHAKGIGRVYDSRRPGTYPPGRCKFPAGAGWRPHERRSCKHTTIEIVHLGISETGELTELVFKWWIGLTLDHIYRYIPNYGMTDAWPQT